MRKQTLALEALDEVAQAIRLRIEVRRVDLIDVAGEDDFGTLSCPGNDGFNLVRRKVLGFVYNKTDARKAATADIRQGCDGKLFLLYQFVDLLVVLIPFVKLVLYKFEVVPQRLHVRIELRFDVTRQIADVLIA